jgi:energy-coupling factor transporter ATP-binding protein EcfA2
MKRISTLSIKGFAGLPIDTRLDFRLVGDDQPTSAIIFGDNGSGKSSIIDAIEFALQNRIRRKKIAGLSKYPPITIPLPAESSECEIKVNFSDGSSYSRSIDRFGKRNTYSFHPDFIQTPFIIRRHDIHRFWMMKPDQRFDFFSDFFQINSSSEKIKIKKSEVRILEIKDRLESLKELKKGYENKISKQLSESRILQYIHSSLGSKGVDVISFIDYNQDDIIVRVKDMRQKIDIEPLLQSMNLGGKITRHDKDSEKSIIITIPILKFGVTVQELIKEFYDQDYELKMMALISELRTKEDELENIYQTSDVAKKIGNVHEWIERAFKSLTRNADIVRSIQYVDSYPLKFLLFNIVLESGDIFFAHEFLSESNLDLLAIITILGMIFEGAKQGQPKILIIDDAIQSVDSVIRTRFFGFLLREFSEWQMIIATHDKIIADELKHLSSYSWIEFIVTDWDIFCGPRIIIQRGRWLCDPLEESLKGADAIQICMIAGRFLEEICEKVTYQLPVAVVRKEKNTLVDLWEPIYKKLKNSSIRSIVDSVNQESFWRNITGAHYNDWAQSISLAEAKDFGNHILSLFKSLYCLKCRRWITPAHQLGKNYWICSCGTISIT